MRAPLTDAELRKAWNDLGIVGHFDSATPAVRLALECTASVIRERKQARVPPPVDVKRLAANDND
ncbi:hypothetical protein ACPUER_22775 [Burkholderia sp. DN3021]|uniref:hypothetical protein n=1 Tax=Burkholderia sp. DN3021 TaxID=3410137 RepID=UPI003C7B4337